MKTPEIKATQPPGICEPCMENLLHVAASSKETMKQFLLEVRRQTTC
jgi:hypothetical protein